MNKRIHGPFMPLEKSSGLKKKGKVGKNAMSILDSNTKPIWKALKNISIHKNKITVL